ncbi:MAG TPA: response regulator transcription factor [Candidatus Faecousia intestinigallinarum]|nr:response regulator transcription factor [Candidatus Faecousia intestinigallinarum]
MGLKIAVCDDRKADAEYVAGLAAQWGHQTGAAVQLEIFHSAEAFLFAYAQRQDVDILLLDVEMGAMDGVTLAKRLRRENETIQIVFITGYSDYISEGYEVAALHYLVKPVKPDKLFAVLDRAAEKLRKNERTLTLKTAEGVVRLPVYQIRYAEVQGNYVTLHAKTQVRLKMSLGELEKRLDDRFYRVGRWAIVNLTCIRRVTKTDIYLQDGAAIPLPRGAYEGVNRAIIQMG